MGFANFFKKSNKNYEITFTSDELKNNYKGNVLKGTDAFHAILFHLKRKISSNEIINLKKLKEFNHHYNNSQYDYGCDKTNNDFNLTMFMPDQINKFRLTGKDEPCLLFSCICSEDISEEKIKTK